MYKDLQQIVPTQKRAEINDKIRLFVLTHITRLSLPR